ncbi:hypothetical protein FJW05_04865 [Mesorhizobium sp. B2-9-1]|uniref:hypothetical protein n=1 Tax=unclassified Mesorhizobium TaxID=325217 RepID=UPI0011261483|nr:MULTISPECIES: hypothetical protein [unclassified Mesorhizobium]TPI48696.1 hypothetical protein FJW05_04865 [Mesorhizobium sp. B2-9-1]TPJ30976.1 hypothetical protein FJ425_04435 [Mesorhizobium sp. B2-7-2]
MHDMTRYYAPEIVRKVRCEALQGIADVYAGWLIYNDDDPYGQDVARKVRDRKIKLWSIDWKKLIPADYAYVEYFDPTVIAYDFNLDSTETNDASFDLNFLNAITDGTVSIPIKTGINRSRNGVQTFTLTDTFHFLLNDLDHDYCDPKSGDVRPGFFSTQPNFVYPIVGKIGIADMVSDFVSLKLFGHLGTDDKPAMAYSQEFTTKIYGDVNPKIEIVSSASFKDGTLGLTNSREDKHKVVIGFSVKVPPEFRSEEKKVGTYVRIEGDATTRRALEEVDRLIQRTEGNVVTLK